MTIVHEDPHCYVVEDNGGTMFGAFDSSMQAYKWAVSPNGPGFPFTIKEVWRPNAMAS